MKTLIGILVISAFLQSSILPFDLVLLILVLRTYVVNSKENLYFAFFMGLLVSHLNSAPLGFESIIYLIIVQVTRMLSKLPISSNIITVLPLVIFASTLNLVTQSILEGSSIRLLPGLVIDAVLALPLYIVIRFWEERFVVKSEIKLKV